MTENNNIQPKTNHAISETFTLKSGENAPDPRALLAKHDEQRKRNVSNVSSVCGTKTGRKNTVKISDAMSILIL